MFHGIWNFQVLTREIRPAGWFCNSQDRLQSAAMIYDLADILTDIPAGLVFDPDGDGFFLDLPAANAAFPLACRHVCVLRGPAGMSRSGCAR